MVRALPTLPRLALLASLAVGPADARGPAVDTFVPRRPVLTFDRTSYDAADVQHLSLVVFSDGHTSLSRAGSPPDPPVVLFEIAPDGSVLALVQGLIAGGATHLSDAAEPLTETAVSTVVFADGRADARAHAFSYWVVTPEYSEVDRAIADFIAVVFPEF